MAHCRVLNFVKSCEKTKSGDFLFGAVMAKNSLRALQEFLFKVGVLLVKIYIVCREEMRVELAIIEKTNSGLHIAPLTLYQPAREFSAYLIRIHSSSVFKNDNAAGVLKQY